VLVDGRLVKFDNADLALAFYEESIRLARTDAA